MSLPASSSVETFGSLLRQMRLERKLSQGRLAELAQMSIEAVSALERGLRRSPQQQTIALLIAALELEPADARKLEAIAEPRVGRALKNEPIVARAHVRGAIPTVIDAIVGREYDLSVLGDLATHNRIVTIAGPGGIGKTRLVLSFAAQGAHDYGEGVFFVDLASITEPETIATTIAEALDVPLGPGEGPARLSEIIDQRRMLAIFDNCEHLTNAVADVIGIMWPACPQLSFLCTSRQPIGIAGEAVFRLSPLEPDAAETLFKQRARSANARFACDARDDANIRELCKKLDGLPLAIELVAARTTALTTHDLLQRIDRPLRLIATAAKGPHLRQQTLRATLDWSFELLDRRERSFFCGLAIFSGGWTLESAHAVAGDPDSDDFDTLELLESLVSKSLVVLVPGVESRYRMLETMRAYGLERIDETGARAAIVRRFIAYFRDVVASIESIVDARAQAERMERLVADRENYRAAMREAIERAPDDALTLFATDFALRWAGIPGDVCAWAILLQPFLEGRDPGTLFRFWRVVVLATRFADFPCSPEAFTGMLTQALGHARASGDPSNIARGIALAVYDHVDRGMLEAAEPLLLEGRALRGVAPRAALQLGDAEAEFALARGDAATAKTHYTQILRGASEAHDATIQFLALEMLFEIALDENDHDEARSIARKADTLRFDSYSGRLRISYAGLPAVLWFAGNERDAFRAACEMVAGYDAYYLQKEAEIRVLALASARAGRFESAAKLEGFARRITLPREATTSKARTTTFVRLLESMIARHIDPSRLEALLAEGALMDHAATRILGTDLTREEIDRLLLR